VKPSIQTPLDQLSARISALEASLTRARGELQNLVLSLSGTIDSEFISLSGTVDAEFVSLSGTLDARLTSLSGTVNALSGTTDAQRIWDGLDPLRGTMLLDDLINLRPGSVAVAGGATVVSRIWEQGHPGIARLTTSTSGTDIADLLHSNESNGTIVIGGGPVRYEACVRIPSADNGINDARRRSGILDFANGNASNTVAFELNRTRWGDNEFRFITAATGSRVEQKTGVTIASNSWYRLRIDVAPDADAVTGSIFCSGNLISTLATRTFIPTGVGVLIYAGMQMIKSLGGGAVNFDADYQLIRQTLTGSRI
jgi:hypothetical protein